MQPIYLHILSMSKYKCVIESLKWIEWKPGYKENHLHGGGGGYGFQRGMWFALEWMISRMSLTCTELKTLISFEGSHIPCDLFNILLKYNVLQDHIWNARLHIWNVWNGGARLSTTILVIQIIMALNPVIRKRIFVSFRDFTVEVIGIIEYSSRERQRHMLPFISYSQIADTHDNISKGEKNYSKPIDFQSM